MPLGDLRLQATFWPGGRVPADGHVALWGGDDPAQAATGLGIPAGEPAVLPTVLAASPRARRKVLASDVPARVIPLRSAVRALAALPPPDAWPSWQRPGDSLLAWAVATKLALEHVAAGHVVPALRRAGPGRAVAHWRLAPGEDGRFAALATSMPPAAHALRRDEDDEAVWPAGELLAAFADAVADMCARTGAGAGPAARAGTGKIRPPSFEQRWTTALTGDDPVVDVPGDELVDELYRWSAGVAHTGGPASARLCVQLHTPASDDPDAGWPLMYHLQGADDPSLMVAAEQVWAVGSASMRVLGRHVGDPQESLVRGLAEAARLFRPIDASLSEARPAGLGLDPGQAAEFLAHGAGSLVGSGLGV